MVFEGEMVLALPMELLPAAVVGAVADFLSEVSLLKVVDRAVDILLGAPNAGLDIFSSPDVTEFVASSIELMDARGLWPLADLVELAVGFRSVELWVGRAGGLLIVAPVVVLAVAADGVFKPDDAKSFGFVVEDVIVRFGIEPTFCLGTAGLDSTAGCSMVSAGASMADHLPEASC